VAEITPDIVLFCFGKRVRLAGAADALQWVAADVCGALGIKYTARTLRGFDADALGADVTDPAAPGRPKLRTVTEPGLYRLIGRSRTPQAAAFRRWLCHDALPGLSRLAAIPPSPAQSQAPAIRAIVTAVVAQVMQAIGPRRLALPPADSLSEPPAAAPEGQPLAPITPRARGGCPIGRLRSTPPRYRLHKHSGQAIVTIQDHDVYLGRYGTPQSIEAYRSIITSVAAARRGGHGSYLSCQINGAVERATFRANAGTPKKALPWTAPVEPAAPVEPVIAGAIEEDIPLKTGLIRVVDIGKIAWLPVPVSGATASDWIKSGIGGVRLDFVRVGKANCTTEGAVLAFFRRVALGDAAPPALPEPEEYLPPAPPRSAAIGYMRACAILDAAGITTAMPAVVGERILP
jgi:hypothetical protein